MHRVSGGGQWLEGDRIDAATSHELAMMYGIERAAVVNAFLRWLLRHLGALDTRLLWIRLGTPAVAADRSGGARTAGRARVPLHHRQVP